MPDSIAGNTSTGAALSASHGSYSSTIDFNGDTDWFSVYLTAGAAYQIWLEGVDSGQGSLGDPYLAVYNASGGAVAWSDDYHLRDPFLNFVPSVSGTYFLSAEEFGHNAGGTYQITIESDAPASSASPFRVDVNGITAGRLDNGDTADWIGVNLVAGTTYQFDLAGAADDGRFTNTLADPWLALRSAGGSLIASDDDSGVGFNSRLTYTATTSGTYFLDVEAVGANTTGSYQLLVNASPVTGSLGIGATVDGSLEFVGDIDLYAVSLVAGTTYNFSLNGNTLIDPYLELLNGSRAVVTSSDDYSGLDAFFSYTPTVGGTYYLAARASGHQESGTYSLAASAAGGGSGGGDDHAGSAATSGSVAPGGSTAGRIETAGDRDWFAVNLSAGQSYTFELNAAGGDGLADPYLALYNGSGGFLAVDDDSGTGLNSALTYTAASSGTYYLEARAYGSQTGSYLLSSSGAPGSDNIAPTVLAFSPADEAGSVAIGSNVVLTFSETVQRGTGVIYLTNTAGTVIEAFDATTSSRLSIWGSSLILDPSASLAHGTGYRVEFGAGTVRDLAGNSYAGSAHYNFTTQAASGADDYAGSAATSGSLLAGSSVGGQIETAGDRDWFAVNLSAGQSYTFRLNAGSGNGLSDPYLTLYNGAGSFMAVDDDSGDGLNSALAFTAAASGTYYLEARAYGSQVGSYVLSSSGMAASDGTAPTVLSFSPADDTGSVAVGANIALYFSEAVQRGSGTIYLKDAAGTVIEAFDAATSTRLAVSGSSLVLDPTASLAHGTSYSVEFAAGTVRDLAGNAYAGTSGYNFSTVADSTAPTVLAFSPADEASSVALGANVTLTFSEAVQRGAGTIYLKTAAGTVVESFDAATSSRLSFSGGTLVLDPTASLSAGTAYRVEFGAGTVRDLAGNAYAGTTGYNFTTVAGTGGDDYAAHAGTAGVLHAGSTTAGSIETVGDRDWFAVNLSAGQSYTFQLNATSNGLADPYLSLYNGSGSFLRADDDSGEGLNSALSYTALASGTYYLEARGYSSQVGGYVLSASGTAAGDITAPTVLSFSPADEAGSVAVGANVVLNFSEAVQRGAGTIYLKNAAGSVIEAFDAATSSRLSLSGSSLVLDPTATLADGGSYRVEFGAGTVRDLAGNAWAGTTGYNFTTVADFSAPTVLSFSPADEASGIAVAANVTLTFSEAIQRGFGTIHLKNAAGAVIESFDAATSTRLSISGASLTLDPTANLANSTGYRVEFASGTVRDLAGNGYAGTTGYNFSTVAGSSGDDYLGSSGTAGVAPVGGSVSGRIETAGDKDWFAVDLVAGQSYTFRLNATASNGLNDPYLTLYNGSSGLLASNDDGDSGYNSMLSYTATASGRYYLEARAYNGDIGNYTLGASASTASGGGGTGGGAGGGSGGGTSGFSITIAYSGNPSYQAYFTAAAQRWSEIITADLPDVSSSRGLIDDLLIDASVVSIDGAGGTLARAGFTALRDDGLPYLGLMQFDSADLADMIAQGTFDEVVLHEMGHVLGLTGWMYQHAGLVSPGDIYTYTGANAVQAYNSLVAANPSGVPLETTGGAGTAASHWSEALFDRELMTGFSESSSPMPLSIITIGALADLGYTVNYGAADPYGV